MFRALKNLRKGEHQRRVIMKKILAVVVAMSALTGSAFAAGNVNVSTIGQFGVGNLAAAAQGGLLNTNISRVTQRGAFNEALTLQGGAFNTNISSVRQVGFGNSVITTQY
jgi:hypothetical protein